MRQPTAIVLFGHGSRDALWRLPMEAIRNRIRDIAPTVRVECAYLELMLPSLEDAVRGLVETGIAKIRITPMFLGVGRHVREDLPRIVDALRAAHSRIEFTVDAALGEQAEIVDLLAHHIANKE